ncbi:MAG: PEP-CTERM sorting domain-containing protein [Planctomycetales bacterium]|nr:PEP-CTERM sorting domain-containing protein [Planctomycetales bacterium]MCA9166263.1 PEP-CTERM sorting domain-containing protein [Planctomycetales bacterium]
MLNKYWNRAAALAAALLLSAGNLAVAQTTLLSEDFEGLTLKDATSATETAAPGVWTDEAPAGWTRDNTTTPLGDPVEFQGWTFLNKDWWISTAGDQDRSTFTAGQGVVAVADPDEYDDGTDIDTGNFNVFLSTPAIDLSGIAAGSVRVQFDSSFRAEVTQIGQLDVSYDGTTYTNILEYDSAQLNDGEVYNDAVDLTLSNPAGGSMWLRWGMVQGSNDWWWAVDNINVSGRQVPEPATATLAAMAGLALLGFRRR